jgi:hypothetical protein
MMRGICSWFAMNNVDVRAMRVGKAIFVMIVEDNRYLIYRHEHFG